MKSTMYRNWLWGISLLFFASANAQQLAFPGAEGFGRYSTGGRGGSVYHVTNLNDAGAGSFRDAVSKSNRTVVFDVGGIINLTSRVVISSNVTVAGQTAPGDGILIYGDGISTSGAHDVILRYLRVRMGINGTSGKDAIAIANGYNQMFDHVSVSWGRDETFSISWDSKGTEPSNITIQNCIIAQGLETHSCGGLIQTDGGISIFRCLYIDNKTRNPKVKGVNEFTNNVVYNWGGGGGYILGDSDGPSYANIVNNYFINGPSTSVAAFTRGNLNFSVYASNNWQDSDKDGVLDGAVLPKSAYGTVTWVTTRYNYPTVGTLLSPTDAVNKVIAIAGASYPKRDKTDTRLITELRSFGTMGQLISNETASPMNGVGTVNGGTAPTDTDRDGMPNSWETANGTDPSVADNNGDKNGNGYTNLEDYVNGLVANIKSAMEYQEMGESKKNIEPTLTCFPNPVINEATIQFKLNTEEKISLSIYDLNGKLVCRIVNKVMPAGYHEITWNGTGSDAQPLNAGVYLCALETGKNKIVKKITLNKE